MKVFKLIGAAVAASLLLLTSCLGESNNTVTRAGFGVAGLSEKTYKTVLNTNMGSITLGVFALRKWLTKNLLPFNSD